MMKWLEVNFVDDSGQVVGHLSGVVCEQIEEVFTGMGMGTDKDLMSKWESRIPGGFKFPCAVLSQISVYEGFEDQGFGSKGVKKFNKLAISAGCVMAVVRVGWSGDPISEKKRKNLHFYKKTGWSYGEQQNEYQQYLGYRYY